MPEYPAQAPDPQYLWDHMRTQQRFRLEAEEQLKQISESLKILPEIQRELSRQSVALWARNADNEFGMPGIQTMAREAYFGGKWAKPVAYALGGVIAGLLGLFLRVLWELFKTGAIKSLI